MIQAAMRKLLKIFQKKVITLGTFTSVETLPFWCDILVQLPSKVQYALNFLTLFQALVIPREAWPEAKVRIYSLHTSLVAHQAGAYPKYFYSPLDGMLVHRRVSPSSEFAGNHFYTWVRERHYES